MIYRIYFLTAITGLCTLAQVSAQRKPVLAAIKFGGVHTRSDIVAFNKGHPENFQPKKFANEKL